MQPGKMSLPGRGNGFAFDRSDVDVDDTTERHA